jgi:hypothetical protein
MTDLIRQPSPRGSDPESVTRRGSNAAPELSSAAAIKATRSGRSISRSQVSGCLAVGAVIATALLAYSHHALPFDAANDPPLLHAESDFSLATMLAVKREATATANNIILASSRSAPIGELTTETTTPAVETLADQGATPPPTAKTAASTPVQAAPIPSAAAAPAVVNGPNAARQLSDEEVEKMRVHARHLLAIGDISGARLFLQRAIAAGCPVSTMTMEETYDPVFLAKNNVIGLAPNPAVAKTYYKRALDFGNAEAEGRLQRLR